jgi:cytochrome c-type biogenesis protein CcmH/NrfG
MGKVSKERKRDSSRRKGKDDKREAELSKMPKTNGFKRFFLPCLLIVVVGILAYSNSFDSPFLWDEHDFLVQNPIVKNLAYFWEPSRAKDLDPDYYIFLKTRYIGYLSFAINYKLHRFNVYGYHFFNLAIHLLNALGVYLLVSLTFNTPFLKASSLKKHSNLLALFSALLFVSHPLQTEAVTYIFQRHASFVTFFYLAALVFYIQGRLCIGNQESSHFKSVLYFIFSLLSTLLAMKTKENAFTLPIVILIYEFFFFVGRTKTRVLRLLPWLLCLVIVPYSVPSSLVITEIPKGAYLFTQFSVILKYIRLLFIPIHQNLDYDYPIYHSFFVPQVAFPFLFHLAVLGVGVYLFYRSRLTIPDLRLSSFGIFWFFITLSVESSIIPLQMIICEYRVYLPSIGWVVTIMTSLWIALEKLESRFPELRRKVILSLVLVVIFFSVLTFARNAVWTDEVRMWKDVVSKSPNKARGHLNLGIALGKQGRIEEAMREFETTLKLNSKEAKAHNGLGMGYHHQGRLDDAIKEYQTALAIKPKDANVHINLGIVYQRKGLLDDAAREFRAALLLNPNDASAHNNLGVILGLQGRLDEAIREFKTALEIDPDHVKARNNLSKIYGQ